MKHYLFLIFILSFSPQAFAGPACANASHAESDLLKCVEEAGTYDLALEKCEQEIVSLSKYVSGLVDCGDWIYHFKQIYGYLSLFDLSNKVSQMDVANYMRIYIKEALNRKKKFIEDINREDRLRREQELKRRNFIMNQLKDS